MPIVPTPKADFLQFCADHEGAWTSNAAAIGLTAAQVTDWKNAVAKAQDNFGAASAAREAAKSATMDSDQSIRAARQKTAELLRLIKNRAVSNNDEHVYVLAQIPAPANPSTLPPPGQPFMLRAELQVGGILDISWKCANPEGAQGTFYLVRRRLGGGSTGPFTFIGGSGSAKRFVDATVPAGTAVVQYQVQGQRGALTGPASETFTVNFGVGGGGEAFIASTSGGGTDTDDELKIAA